ncbi:MAG: exodeoxyribonuclease VII large subunit [Rhodospirillales bacterium]
MAKKAAPDNAPVLSVSGLSQALKRAVEGAFGRVRVRGEISGFKQAASGHLYFSLKDENAVLDAVCWRSAAGRLGARPEDGLDVIVTGKLSTYPGRSRYQIIVESLEAAGEGALLKMLEQRRRALLAEGLFDDSRKQELPWLPDVIGVVTSPTGAVLRDIRHRIEERWPRRILVWPVLVQGDGAAAQIAAAIKGFNNLPPRDGVGGPVPRPDVLIVGRGGGSLEDLWAFNEEIVVRAAAESEIPLISAVGHETDTTLIDFAADVRAPTPTAAAEFAVPVRLDVAEAVEDFSARTTRALMRAVRGERARLEGLARGLPDAQRVLAAARQRADDWGERLRLSLSRLVTARRRDLSAAGARLRPPRERAARAREDLTRRGAALDRNVRRRREALAGRTAELERLLESVSPRRVIERGYAVVRDAGGRVISNAAGLRTGGDASLDMRDGRAAVRVVSVAGGEHKFTSAARKPRSKKGAGQEDLF